jgi:drug/metabolite transporter (DMT)-like permease
VTISRTLYYLTLRRLTLSVHTIILTLSPAIAILWTLFLFSIWPSPLQLMGGAAIIAGVLMVSTGQAKNLAGKKGQVELQKSQN